MVMYWVHIVVNLPHQPRTSPHVTSGQWPTVSKVINGCYQCRGAFRFSYNLKCTTDGAVQQGVGMSDQCRICSMKPMGQDFFTGKVNWHILINRSIEYIYWTKTKFIPKWECYTLWGVTHAHCWDADNTWHLSHLLSSGGLWCFSMIASHPYVSSLVLYVCIYIRAGQRLQFLIAINRMISLINHD